MLSRPRCYPRPEKEDYSSSGNEVEIIEIDTPIYIRAISIRSFEILTRRRKLYLYYIEETSFITVSIVEKAITVKKEELSLGDNKETRRRVVEVVDRYPYFKLYTSIFSKRESN
jgi:hypothetical protein